MLISHSLPRLLHTNNFPIYRVHIIPINAPPDRLHLQCKCIQQHSILKLANRGMRQKYRQHLHLVLVHLMYRQGLELSGMAVLWFLAKKDMSLQQENVLLLCVDCYTRMSHADSQAENNFSTSESLFSCLPLSFNFVSSFQVLFLTLSFFFSSSLSA